MLAPAATTVDLCGVLPPSHLDALADAGLYAPPVDLDTLGEIVETLAAACLSTAFVWIQHLGFAGLVASRPDLEQRWSAAVRSGGFRTGIALAGLLPHAPLRARRRDDGWVLTGSAPWVTGWDRVDAVLVAARGPDDTIVSLLLDTGPARGLTVERPDLVAVQASSTVHLGFDDVLVPAERELGVAPFVDRSLSGLRLNGHLALGLVRRCAEGLDGAWGGALDAARDELVRADDPAAPIARARACELAVRAAAAWTVAAGSRSVRRDADPQRAAREATFLLVFGSRPPIRTELLRRLAIS